MTADERGRGGALEMPFEAYGVRMLVRTNSHDLYERLPAVLPPGASPCAAEGIKHTLALDAQPDGTFAVYADGYPFLWDLSLEMGLEVLDSQVRAHVALAAPDRVFVHAGVVGLGDRALLIPGPSFSGKSTLVAELVRAGAVYYSDEFAVLDEQGLVHPYPKPVALRGEDSRQVDHPVANLGGVAGERPLEVGTIVICTYSPDVEWRPSALTAGQAVLAMLANTVPARSRPAQAIRSISRAVAGATVLEGERGEAVSVVPYLLDAMSA